MAGASAERQERGVIEKITQAIRANKQNPVTVVAGKTKIDGVVKAEKYGGRQLTGSEPYTDVVLHVKTAKGVKKVNLSLKGESAPSLAGGGLKGLNLAVPGLAKRFMKTAHHKLKASLKVGSKVPDVFGKINRNDKLKIVIGTETMGGPIDYMYIGPMTVVGRYDPKKNELVLNGTLTEAKTYAIEHELYFRLRARREDQRFDPDAMDKDGTPKIYGVSPSRGDSAGRIVITDKVPAAATTVVL